MCFNPSMSLRIRTESDFDIDAFELMRRYGHPGDLPLAKEALKHGYQIGLKDATDALRAANDKVAAVKERSNAPS